MSDLSPVYDQIGVNYATRRCSDPRWQRVIDKALSGVTTLVNIGAGTGSYEPEGIDVIAVEPSRTMIAQRQLNAAPAVCAIAESLPFPDKCFAAAMAVLTVHHWQSAASGLAQMCRVASRQIVLTWDPQYFAESFWLVRDYVPEVTEREQGLATLDTVVSMLRPHTVVPLLVPWDCADGFLGAFWQRPEIYLDPIARAAMSGLTLLDDELVAKRMERLQHDLADGSWAHRNAEIGDLNALDIGYRLVIAGDQDGDDDE